MSMQYEEGIRRVLDVFVRAADDDYADLEDVQAAREIAALAGLDPADYTSQLWKYKFPHAFVPTAVSVDSYRGWVPDYTKQHSLFGEVVVSRPETDEEVYARIGGRPVPVCRVYCCGQLAGNPIHLKDLEETG